MSSLRAEVLRLRAIIAGRTVAPTDEEIAQHWRSGGGWLYARPQGCRASVTVAIETTQSLARDGIARSWWALDADGRLCDWPVLLDVAPGNPMANLDALATLSDGWDGEDAPPPSAVAIDAAREVLRALLARDVTTLDVDADVMGGVAVTLYGTRAGHSAWFACSNGGHASLMLSCPDGALPGGETLGPGSVERAVAWVS